MAGISAEFASVVFGYSNRWSSLLAKHFAMLALTMCLYYYNKISTEWIPHEMLITHGLSKLQLYWNLVIANKRNNYAGYELRNDATTIT